MSPFVHLQVVCYTEMHLLCQARSDGGEMFSFKVESKKLEWNVQSRVGSLDNAKHKASGGDKKVCIRKCTNS